jgi:hypothetical protein
MPRKSNASAGAGFNQPALKIIQNPSASTVKQALANAKKLVEKAKQK